MGQFLGVNKPSRRENCAKKGVGKGNIWHRGGERA